ncbi:MAG: hypothetical protein EP343_15430 [Deltaproteobacteria bacterium]|nr:MAG: hypothetical protein EP343_15430 [Deltaproteobacteria bacterium]
MTKTKENKETSWKGWPSFSADLTSNPNLPSMTRPLWSQLSQAALGGGTTDFPSWRKRPTVFPSFPSLSDPDQLTWPSWEDKS